MQRKNKTRKAQVSIFVIIAVILVVIVGLFFFLKDKVGIKFGGVNQDFITNPEIFIDSCLQPSVRETADLMIKQGGYVNPTLYRDFENERVAYLCYQEDYYYSCVNQEAVLLTHLKDEIREAILPDMNDCFKQLEDGIKRSGGSFTRSNLNYEIKLDSKRITVEISLDGKIEKSGEMNNVKAMRSVITHPLYDLAVVVQEITRQEAEHCDFEQLGFMLFYPHIGVEKFVTGDDTTVYTVIDRESNKNFRFAVRSCVVPPATTGR